MTTIKCCQPNKYETYRCNCEECREKDCRHEQWLDHVELQLERNED